MTGLVGIWTDPHHRIEYTSAENTHAEWLYPEMVPSLQMDRSQRVRIDWALNRNFPHLDPNP